MYRGVAVVFTPRSGNWVNESDPGGTILANALNAAEFNRLDDNDEDLNARLGALEAGGGTATPLDGSVTNTKVAVSADISLDKTADSINRLAMTPAERSKLSTLALGGIVSGYVPSGSATPSIVHSLGTTDLVVSVHEESTGLYPLVAAASTDINTVQLTFAFPPNANQYRYTIVAKSAVLAAPQVRDIPVVQPYASSLTLNATAGNNRICTATGNITLNEPTGGADGQLIMLRVIASGAQRVVTFGAALKRPGSIASSLTVPSGQRGTVGLYFESTYGWTVTTAFTA
jgi:hypothetical protein